MKMTVDFEECLKDSPRFRAALEEVEGDVAELELKLDKLVKLCIAMIDTGKAFCVANKQFMNGIRDLAQYSSNDAVVETSLTKFSDSLQEMINFHTRQGLPLSLRLECRGMIIALLWESSHLRMILFDQTQRSIKAQLQNFVKEDLRKFKDAKKQFEKVSEEKENALVKNAQVQRNKQHEVEEATNILTATRKCFRHIALDYVLQINVLQSKRRSEILKSMLSFMYAHLAFFHQGYDLFSELGPYMKDLGAQLDRLVVDAAKEKREMEQKHSTIQQKDFSSDDSKLEYNVDAANGIVMEGYLFKRASNAFKTWNRRWFSIQNNQLVYQKKFKDNPTVVVEDLRLCTVKHCEDIERRFCFEVVSPTKSCMLQADSEKLRQAWIKAVQTSIATAYREKGDESEKLDKKSSPSTGSLDSGNESKEKLLKGESALQRVQCIPGNASCCDCGLADPRWASINLGITLCIECSGIHRSLGVHFSKVRSLTLDTWEPELLKLMCELGNDVINRVYEANVEKMGIKKPQPGQRQEKEAYIRAKYVERKFVDKYSISLSPPEQQKKFVSKSSEEKRLSISKFGPGDQVRASAQSSVRSNDSGIQQSSDDGRESLPSTVSANSLYEPEGERQDSSMFLDSKHLNPGLQLYRASYEKNLPKMAEALAHGADVNWANSEENKATPLIQAVLGGSLVTCEFLLQNGANVNQRDVQGRGPLHHATVLGHTGQVCLFLKRGANQHATDEEGKDPLSIAVEAANADIVTLLRLARMNEEMRESEGLYGQPGDETYQDIFRDFSQMASNNPEKLNRFQQDSQKF
ncbi:arf-GAP with coiled-coil, ANK repeat and PH domain-containing protein 2 isoform X10 [Gorilla gorilla gorilla]|uniref:arf-GAP with coiled-coil, ANK repeat and PH domain-containing protein 2 isoform X7 n=1 Tax=Homo sapiens TaxID=9606 RepID=UPI0007DC6B34|nr:arf-GAP with coiled-coil, ANK repeat and PH domain-containing protein 2 isoform X7 [Homo sapiens]XP_054201891.1 arf-GAP with coiled-coil, ANK repeat and PH domain-containing protein 2 isoform X7 [Homo sapiens]XP_054538400.1 arf-GAP with coiled-coil, ANK repeat and PH domain-containing protein 2 isoform X13 [Pan troglodytes]XP_054966979.1 arf-GAP with coiled-coil, ANK repeat and PH domain-containing protein 2 isoform X6 [Pan paniscus]XP_055238674.1 arf-GAP with coiled-coil, ANK repeat and PH |eukprot:XP_016861538.1 arf-GAP with coiled-coil, ANK repeat and PH domain-containing protein 2 isoform X6 [Homo sapiens]